MVSLLDNCFRDCPKKHFQMFKYKCVYDINFKSIGNNEIFN